MSEETPRIINVRKQSMTIPLSEEFVAEAEAIRHALDLALGLVEPTPEEAAEMAAAESHRAELRAAGLLDDLGGEIGPTDCPACLVIADSTAAGWSGPLGDYVRCGRPRGHDLGQHAFKVLWDDDERPEDLSVPVTPVG